MKTVSKHKKTILVALLLSTFISVGKFAFGQSPVLGCDASFKQSTLPFAVPAIYTPYNWVSLQAENQNYQSYTWDFGDGIIDTGRYFALHQYAKPGKYLVTLKVYNPVVGQLQVVCEDTKNLWVTISDSLKFCDASFTHDVFILKTNPPSYSVSFAAKNKDYRTYTWDFGDGAQDTGRTVTHHYAKGGLYNVTLKVYSPTVGQLQVICEDKKTEAIALGDVKKCDATFSPVSFTTFKYPPAQHVEGFIALYKNYTSYKWDFGDGTSDTGATVKHTYAKEGKYYVTLSIRDTKTECSDVKSQWVTEGEIGVDTDLCKARVTLSSEGNKTSVRDELVYRPLVYDGIGVSRTWNWGDGSPDGYGEMTSHTYAHAGEYIITLTKTATHNPCMGNPGCNAAPTELCTEKYTYSVTIGIKDTLQCIAAPAAEISGLKVKLFDRLIVDHFDNTILEDYRWDFGDGTIGVGRSVEHAYPAPKLYTAKLTKRIFKVICPPNPGGVTCLALPIEICSKTYDVVIDLSGTNDTICKASFFTFTKKNTLTVKTNQVAGIGYAQLDFGDGDMIETKSSHIIANHTYTKPGKYFICFRIATVHDSLLPVVLLRSYCSDTFCQTIAIGDTVSEDNEITTGTGDFLLSKKLTVRAYPMPAQNEIHFEVKNASSHLTLRLFDTIGNQVKEVTNINNGNFTLEVPELGPGVYMYSLFGQEGTVSKGKVILVK